MPTIRKKTEQRAGRFAAGALALLRRAALTCCVNSIQISSGKSFIEDGPLHSSHLRATKTNSTLLRREYLQCARINLNFDWGWAKDFTVAVKYRRGFRGETNTPHAESTCLPGRKLGNEEKTRQNI